MPWWANDLVVQAGAEPRVVAVAKCFEGGGAVAGVGRAVHGGERPRSELRKAADPWCSRRREGGGVETVFAVERGGDEVVLARRLGSARDGEEVASEEGGGRRLEEQSRFPSVEELRCRYSNSAEVLADLRALGELTS